MNEKAQATVGQGKINAATEKAGSSCAIQERLPLPLLIVTWLCRVTAAVILLQTLFFKFTGAPESVYIFTKVGMEPWGRYGSGVVELIAAVLLLVRCRAWLGALLAMGVMGGAIASHLTVLGIEVQGDHGLLFMLAVTVFVTSAFVAYVQRKQIPYLPKRLKA